jgi:2'-5' RNA ligase
MTQTDPIRSFIAVPLAVELQGTAEQWQQEFRAAGADVRWVPVADLHFTLKFLGDVAVADLDPIRQVCAARADLTKPFDLCLQGTGVFPNPQRPRVVWIGAASGAVDLTALARGLEKDLAGLGFAPEKKPFRAHLTLGRCRSPRGARDLLTALEKRREELLGGMRVDHFNLMQSELTPRGAIYTVLNRFELRP